MRSRSLAATALLALLATAPIRAEKPAVKDAFLTMSDGAKIHYLEAGKGSPIVFIPGWTMAADIWEGQIAYFSKAHRVVAYDPRSQGRSSKTADGSFPLARAADLKAILEQLSLDRATLVCWSMAVSECAAYVGLYGTGRISGLVLVDGFVGDPGDPQRIAGTLQYIAQMQRNRRQLTESFVRSMYKKPRSEEYLKHVVEQSLQTPADTAVALFVGTPRLGRHQDPRPDRQADPPRRHREPLHRDLREDARRHPRLAHGGLPGRPRPLRRRGREVQPAGGGVRRLAGKAGRREVSRAR